MRKELAISGAIIGVSLIAAVAIAGGPQGIWPDDADEVTIDAGFGDGTATTTTIPDRADEADDTDGNNGDEPDTTEPDDTDPSISVGDDESADTTAPPGTSELEATVSQGTVIAGTDDQSPDGLPERSTLRVAVANGAGIGGLAGEHAARLAGLGYVEPAAVNAEPFGLTLVYATDEALGRRLADDLGLPAEAVQPFADVPPVETTTDAFDLIVVLGTDQRADG